METSVKWGLAKWGGVKGGWVKWGWVNMGAVEWGATGKWGASVNDGNFSIFRSVMARAVTPTSCL